MYEMVQSRQAAALKCLYHLSSRSWTISDTQIRAQKQNAARVPCVCMVQICSSYMRLDLQQVCRA